MQVTIELPDELAEQIPKSSSDLARRLWEAFAAEKHRRGAITGAQGQSLLGLASRSEVDQSLNRSSIYREYGAEELELDYAAGRKASTDSAQKP